MKLGVMVHGRDPIVVDVLLDTGSQHNVLPAWQARAMGWRPPRRGRGDARRTVVAFNGQEVPVLGQLEVLASCDGPPAVRHAPLCFAVVEDAEPLLGVGGLEAMHALAHFGASFSSHTDECLPTGTLGVCAGPRAAARVTSRVAACESGPGGDACAIAAAAPGVPVRDGGVPASPVGPCVESAPCATARVSESVAPPCNGRVSAGERAASAATSTAGAPQRPSAAAAAGVEASHTDSDVQTPVEEARGPSASALGTVAMRQAEPLAGPDVVDDGDDAGDGSWGGALGEPPGGALRDERPHVQQLLSEYADVFSDDLSRASDVAPLRVEMQPAASVVYGRPRPLAHAYWEVVRRELQRWLDDGVVRPSNEPQGAPLVVVNKKADPQTGEPRVRLCVDFTLLNRVMHGLPSLQPTAAEVRQCCAGQRRFALLDLRSGFNQLPVHEGSRHLLTVATPWGVYEFCRVPFGLCTAAQYFQATMMHVLRGLVGVTCHVYIDDIAVWGDSSEQLMGRVRAVLERCRAVGIRLNGKAVIDVPQLKLLGLTVDGEGTCVSDDHLRALREYAVPASSKQLQRFVGFVNYFREFVPRFGELVRPLQDLLVGGRAAFRWAEEHQRAFESLIGAVVSATKLYHFVPGAATRVVTDASDTGVAATLLQQTGSGRWRPLAFASKKLNAQQQRWSTLAKEAYAFVYALQRWRHVLLGRRFVWNTDHRNLLFMQDATDAKVRRWWLVASEYQFTVEHISGPSNAAADALSRCAAASGGPLRQRAAAGAVRECAAAGAVSAVGAAAGVLMGTRAATCAAVRERPTVAPELAAQRREVIEATHGGSAGHMGCRATVRRIIALGKPWPGLRRDVQSFVAACPVCQKTSVRRSPSVAPRVPTMAEERFQVVVLDTCGPLPEVDGCRHVIVIMDVFTRWVELVAVPSTEARFAADALTAWCGRYGVPQAVRTDRGPQFDNQLFNRLCERFGAARQLTYPGRHEANGLVERAIREVRRHLQALMMDTRERRWPMLLPVVQAIMNSARHSSTGVSPAQLVLGGGVDLLRGLLGGALGGAPGGALGDALGSAPGGALGDALGSAPGAAGVSDVGGGDAAEDGAPAVGAAAPEGVLNADFKEYLAGLDRGREQLRRASQAHQQRLIDQQRGDDGEHTEFAVGALVLARDPAAPMRDKMLPRWRGPCQVVRRHNDFYVCRDLGEGREVTRHVTLLKEFDASRTPDPAAVAAADKDMWLVERIVAHRGSPHSRGKMRFRVRWKGFEASDDTWEPWASVRQLAALREYAAAHPSLSWSLGLEKEVV